MVRDKHLLGEGKKKEGDKKTRTAGKEEESRNCPVLCHGVVHLYTMAALRKQKCYPGGVRFAASHLIWVASWNLDS